MAYLIGNARNGESGARGGQAGDQTGREVCTQNYYSYPWNYVIRANDADKRETIAAAMEAACANNKIGYDQGQRLTLAQNLVSMGGYTVANIKSLTTACETDCSALVAVCCLCAGIKISTSCWTGNLRQALEATGMVTSYSSSAYTGGTSKLLRGDILLNTQNHVAVYLSGYVGTSSATTANADTSTTTSTTKASFGNPCSWKNSKVSRPVYADTEGTTQIGSVNAGELCSCYANRGNMYLIIYKVDGAQNWKAGWVQYSGGCSNFVTPKTWTNSSATRTVYADWAMSKKVGTINANASCRCYAATSTRFMIEYKINSGAYKVGYVDYAGGVK